MHAHTLYIGGDCLLNYLYLLQYTVYVKMNQTKSLSWSMYSPQQKCMSDQLSSMCSCVALMFD